VLSSANSATLQGILRGTFGSCRLSEEAGIFASLVTSRPSWVLSAPRSVVMASDESEEEMGEDCTEVLPETRGALKLVASLDLFSTASTGNGGAAVKEVRTRFDAAWVKALDEQIRAEVESEGMQACTWENLLERWSKHIYDAPYEEVGICGVKYESTLPCRAQSPFAM